MKHKRWHFFYGKKTEWEVVYQTKNYRTSNYWDICKKCGQQIGEKQSVTTLSCEIELIIK